MLYLRCLTGLWIRLCKNWAQVELHLRSFINAVAHVHVAKRPRNGNVNKLQKDIKNLVNNFIPVSYVREIIFVTFFRNLTPNISFKYFCEQLPQLTSLASGIVLLPLLSAWYWAHLPKNIVFRPSVVPDTITSCEINSVKNTKIPMLFFLKKKGTKLKSLYHYFK